MVPTPPQTSRFDEPSTGSVHTTTAFPAPASSSTGSGASSEMIAAQAPVSVYPGVISADDLRRYADLQAKHGLTTEIDVEELIYEP